MLKVPKRAEVNLTIFRLRAKLCAQLSNDQTRSGQGPNCAESELLYKSRVHLVCKCIPATMWPGGTVYQQNIGARQLPILRLPSYLFRPFFSYSS